MCAAMTQCKAATKKGDRCKRAVAIGHSNDIYDFAEEQSPEVGAANVKIKAVCAITD
jgi:hypothetical protein